MGVRYAPDLLNSVVVRGEKKGVSHGTPFFIDNCLCLVPWSNHHRRTTMDYKSMTIEKLEYYHKYAYAMLCAAFTDEEYEDAVREYNEVDKALSQRRDNLVDNCLV
jgi:hypothetical protein